MIGENIKNIEQMYKTVLKSLSRIIGDTEENSEKLLEDLQNIRKDLRNLISTIENTPKDLEVKDYIKTKTKLENNINGTIEYINEKITKILKYEDTKVTTSIELELMEMHFIDISQTIKPKETPNLKRHKTINNLAQDYLYSL